jgi:myosin heavy subunit
MQQYASRTQDAMALPPHPYAVINGSLQDLIEYQKDQSLLISGESGAGKTVTVKVCLEFLSEIAGSDNGVEQQILASNPILEAFGNAKTKRNDNSSRFGKFMEVHLSDESKKIVACTTVHYLLEKSRVVNQAEGERNFHIFYYLTSQNAENQDENGDEDALMLRERAPESFRFLSKDGSPCAEAEQHNDAEEASAMRAAFTEMKIAPPDQLDVFKCVAAVLHLGDCEFESHLSTGSKVARNSNDALACASALLGVPEDRLEAVMTKHESMQRDGLMTRAFNPAVAGDARNALARHLYGRLFDYLIRRVNAAMDADKILAGQQSDETHFIGMLDIFGFEIFDVNSFEQLSINFANEKLQQLFNRHTFTLEERTYEEEGIAFDHIAFHDSQPLLSFLGMGDGRDTVRDGVFQILDEQTVVGSGSDEKFLQAVGQKHRDKKTLFSDLCKSRTAFKVVHYAGSVEYETGGFVAKNADKLYENIIEAMRLSTSAFVAQLFAESPETTPKKGDAPKHKTQASLFMRQLQALETRTNATFPRYVRCVKPNAFKKPQLFAAPLCLQQLRFAGVFEAVAIRKLGFPFRHTHEHFFSYFKCLCPTDHAKWQAVRRGGGGG